MYQTYGVVAFFRAPKDPTVWFHLVQRRDSLAYIRFMRGNYPESELEELFNEMTEQEKIRMCHYSFPDLWVDLYFDTHAVEYPDYEFAHARFHQFQSRPDRTRLLKESTSLELQWTLPKGRKNRYETPLEGAIREYKEETRSKSELRIIPCEPFLNEESEYYLVNSTEKAKTNYYTLVGEKLQRQSVSNETNDVRWCTLEEATKLLSEKYLGVLRRVSTFLETFELV
jgi:ADP-ribose pyrophosphatase YjhB (NUDIX family)